jgi:hypothetical protein
VFNIGQVLLKFICVEVDLRCHLQDRNVQSSSEWRQAMQEVDISIFKHLRENIANGFDEERFGSRIGFGNLKRYASAEGRPDDITTCITVFERELCLLTSAPCIILVPLSYHHTRDR